MNVAAVTADVSENVAGAGTGALETSIAANRLTATGGMTGVGTTSGGFRSQWQAVWAGLNAKTGNGLVAKSEAASEIDEIEPQDAQDGASRTETGMDQQDAVTTVSPGKAENGALTGFGNLRADGSRPGASVTSSQRNLFDQISHTAALKTQSSAGGDSTPAARPATREDKRTSHAAKNYAHVSISTNAEPQPSMGGTAQAAQQVMPPVAAQMPLLTQRFPANVSATSAHDSVSGAASSTQERSPHRTDALQSGNSAAKATGTGSGNQTIAVAPQSSARPVTGNGATTDAAVAVENEQPAHVPSEALEPASAREHALHADGQDSSSIAVHPSSEQVGTPAMTEVRDSESANRANDPLQAASQAAGIDNAGHFAADGNSGTSLSTGAAKSSTEKLGRAAGAAGTDAQIPHISSPQLSGVETPTPLHVPVAGQGTASAISGHNGETTVAGATMGDPFAVLDTGSGVGKPNWVHAGGQRAEAGFEDPELGWVGVRADLSGGVVHAALVPGSAEAAQVLSAHLPGLSTYLSEQHAPVATLTMETTDGSGAGTGQSMQQNADQNTGQNASAGTQAEARADPAANSPRESPDRATESGAVNPASLTGGLSGTHISVMA